MNKPQVARLAALCSALVLALALPFAAAAQSSGYVTTSDSARLYYIVAGRPATGVDTLIAIHGGPGMDLESIYGDFASRLAQKHVVIFYDQRGGGKSELPVDTSRLGKDGRTLLFMPVVAARQIQDLDEILSASRASLHSTSLHHIPRYCEPCPIRWKFAISRPTTSH